MVEKNGMQNKQRFFALCGIVAPILFTILVIIESLLRPDYSQIYNFVSDLGVGPYAIIQNVNFIIFGLLSIGFAFGLKEGLPSPQGKALKAGIWLVAIFGLGVFFTGVFPLNYLSEIPHFIASFIEFISIIAAQLLIWKGLRSADSAFWGRYRVYSLISGILSIILLVIYISLITANYHGVLQRLFLTVHWIWIEVTALKLYFLTK